MTPKQFKAIRNELGLSQLECGQALGLTGKQPDHTVRMWETGKRPITGPTWRCMEYMRMTRKMLFGHGEVGKVSPSLMERDDLRIYAYADNDLGIVMMMTTSTSKTVVRPCLECSGMGNTETARGSFNPCESCNGTGEMEIKIVVKEA